MGKLVQHEQHCPVRRRAEGSFHSTHKGSKVRLCGNIILLQLLDQALIDPVILSLAVDVIPDPLYNGLLDLVIDDGGISPGSDRQLYDKECILQAIL